MAHFERYRCLRIFEARVALPPKTRRLCFGGRATTFVLRVGKCLIVWVVCSKSSGRPA